MGAVREVAVGGRAQAVAQAYVESNSHDAQVVCSTHEEIDRVTEAIRAALKQNGNLGESVQVERDVPLNWTASQKGDARNFLPGQRLTFHRSQRHRQERIARSGAYRGKNHSCPRQPRGGAWRNRETLESIRSL